MTTNTQAAPKTTRRRNFERDAMAYRNRAERAERQVAKLEALLRLATVTPDQRVHELEAENATLRSRLEDVATLANTRNAVLLAVQTHPGEEVVVLSEEVVIELTDADRADF